MNYSLKWAVLMTALIPGLYAMGAQSETTADSMAKVTIVVDGMMKSKSGAT